MPNILPFKMSSLNANIRKKSLLNITSQNNVDSIIRFWRQELGNANLVIILELLRDQGKLVPTL
jgi:hypothetical protein